MSTETSEPHEDAAPPRRLEDLPGPRALPFFGNTLQIRLADMHRQFEAWSERFGSVYRIDFGPRLALIVADHEVIAQVLRDRPQQFRRPLSGGRISSEMGFDQGVFFANDEVWRHQRRMVMAGLDPAHIKAYFPSLLRVTERLRARWQAAARAHAGIDLQADLMRFTVDAVAGLAFGAEVDTLSGDEDVIQRHLNKIFPALSRRLFSIVPYWRYVKLPKDRELERSVAEVQAAVRGFIAAARERIAADPGRREHPRNLLEAMLNAADQPGSGVGDSDVAGNVLTMLLAGEDTTANTLAWMIHLLHRHPEVLARARAEVLQVAGEPAAFTFDAMSRLDYLEACAHETMRLKPVAPIIAAEAVHDTVVAGVLVPAGTVVIGLMRRDSLREQYFSDAQAFRPERWLDGAAIAATSAKRVAMPFGAGPRMCPGRYLALLEIKMAAAMLLASFDIDEAGGAAGAEVPERLAFSMGPVGLRMRLTERRTVAAAG
ncbi:MAG: cytochrome P450 [Proteobacteria bacterium]|nr:cytochrome P450 [Pseudomonadota bacterium]